MFGNLFRKKSRKPSKDEGFVQEEDVANVKGTTPGTQKEMNKDEDSPKNDRTESIPSIEGSRLQSFEAPRNVIGIDASEQSAVLVDANKESVRLY